MSGRIFVTGDTHGSIDSKKLWRFAEFNPGLDKDDYLIVLGDFGYIWNGSEEEKERIRALDNLPYALLFLDGNHENFDLLEKYEKQKWCGGTVQFISDTVIHLCRGQVYNIAGKRIFAMGGATSIDLYLRTAGKSWWPQEDMSFAEMETGLKNLAAYNNRVDYVLTHCAPTRFAQEILENALNDKHYLDANEMHLEDFRILPLSFKHWYCGHYHVFYEAEKFSCLYNEIEELN